MTSRLSVNTLFLIPNQVGGTEYHLRTKLTEWQSDLSKSEVVVYCNRENAATFSFKVGWKKVVCPVKATNRLARLMYEQLVLPWQAWRDGVEVMYSFGYLGPLLFPKKTVITVHDANWKDCPADFSWLERIGLTLLIELSLWKATTIVTDSAFAYSRLSHHFPQYQQKLVIEEPAVSPALTHELKKKHPNPLAGKKYLLTVSGLYPHKRVPYALELFQAFRRRHPEFEYVLVGRNGKDEATILETIAAEHSVHYYPKVSLSKLAALYTHAQAFIFPSVYEGFGYPVYEALSAKLNVIVGRKELYHQKIQPKLAQLSFKVADDVKILEERLHLKLD